MAERKDKFNWIGIVCQIVTVLVLFIGFTLANEHRMSTVEVGMEELKKVVIELKDITADLNEGQKKQNECLVKLTTIQEMLCKKTKLK